MSENSSIRPTDGGSYRRSKDGGYQRLDKPQQPNPGKSASNQAARKAGAKRAATAKHVRPGRRDKE